MNSANNDSIIQKKETPVKRFFCNYLCCPSNAYRLYHRTRHTGSYHNMRIYIYSQAFSSLHIQ